MLLHLLETKEFDSALVFSRTKYGADKIVRVLNKKGVKAEAIHGNKSQGARQRALGNFKSGKTVVLVATDIAARGIDVSQLSLVINFDLPNVPETYVHRIGRTGRARASGIALSFCDKEERAYLRSIEKLIKQRVPIIDEHPYLNDGEEEATKVQQQPRQPRPPRNPNNSGNNRNHRRRRRPSARRRD
ncbi:UNVERIFIED_CONTAM: hypothetical protein GTU68_007344 [Idotea baltica]|nr:hypothetical protein [Idotea baltica]